MPMFEMLMNVMAYHRRIATEQPKLRLDALLEGRV